MSDFLYTVGGEKFLLNIKSIALALTNPEKQKEKLARDIYAQLVVSDFYKEDNLSYEALKAKAVEAADAYFEK